MERETVQKIIDSRINTLRNIRDNTLTNSARQILDAKILAIIRLREDFKRAFDGECQNCGECSGRPIPAAPHYCDQCIADGRSSVEA